MGRLAAMQHTGTPGTTTRWGIAAFLGALWLLGACANGTSGGTTAIGGSGTGADGGSQPDDNASGTPATASGGAGAGDGSHPEYTDPGTPVSVLPGADAVAEQARLEGELDELAALSAPDFAAKFPVRFEPAPSYDMA